MERSMRHEAPHLEASQVLATVRSNSLATADGEPATSPAMGSYCVRWSEPGLTASCPSFATTRSSGHPRTLQRAG